MRRIRKCLTVEKAKPAANSFINSQFTDAPLIWMFVGKSSIAKNCKTHFRIFQVSNYDDKSYHDLWNFSNDVSIHQKQLGFLVIAVYKQFMNMKPAFIWEFFRKNKV